jgi:hypothetical protein
MACLMALTLTSVSPALADATAPGATAPGATPATAATATATTTAASAAAPASARSITTAPAESLDSAIKEIHETLRRMSSAAGDMLHEVTRTEEVYNNGVPVGKNANPMALSPMYQMNGYQTLQDSLTHAVYLPPRPHWLKNSFDQLSDLQTKLAADAKDIKEILANPDCDSATRAQGMVLGDISAELGRDLDGLKADISAQPLSGAKINVTSHKIIDTISGMEKVADRVWKEAPKRLKKNK